MKNKSSNKSVDTLNYSNSKTVTIQIKIDKLITVDSAKNLVMDYANKAGSLSAHLTTVVAEVTKIFNNLPLDVNKFGNKQEKTEQKVNLTFNSSQKR